MNKKLFLAIIFLATCSANADGCVQNSFGRVICSKYPGGDAMENSFGRIECGKGECRKNNFGRVECSKITGGGAAVNSFGRVECLGGCESASGYMCVNGR